MKEKNSFTGSAYLKANWNRISSLKAGAHMVALEIGGKQAAAALALTESNELRLLLPIEPSEKLPDDLSSDNLLIRRETFAIGNKNQVCADIVCLSSGLQQSFTEFASDILHRIERGIRPVIALAEAVSEFRKLLKKTRKYPISREKVLGLLGELTILSILTKISNAAWKTWNGPLGETYDFLNGPDAIEVKSALHTHEPVVEISNVDQLYAPKGGRLYIVYLSYTPNAIGDYRVPDLIQNIDEMLDDPSGMYERLQNIGYDKESSDAWGEWSFSLTSSSLYLVKDGFPRLPRENISHLPEGVSHLRYRVNLSMADNFKIPSEVDHISIYHRFMGNL